MKGIFESVTGRKKILCDLMPTGDIEQDKYILPRIIDLTLPDHNANVAQMTKLRNYYYNITNVLNKTKTQQPNINNKVAINYPEIAVTTINSYCFSQPLTFSARGADINGVKELNDALDDDSYAQKSQTMWLNSGITALGYRFIQPATEEQLENGIFFETNCNLDPECTYCVYSNDLRQEKICAITFKDKKTYNERLEQESSGRVYTVFTKWHKWEFYKQSGIWKNNPQIAGYNEVGDTIYYEAYPLPYKRIPIIECLRKADGTGDFEAALDLLDAANNLVSSRLDDVQQAVDYILSLRDIDVWSEGALDRVIAARDKGIMAYKSIEGLNVQPDMKIFNVPQNQSTLQSLQDFICEKIEEVLNIPNRETRSSGGDTGSAVESRNGFRSLENIAGLVTSSALKAENESLDVILAICSNIDSCPFKNLKPKDIQIKDNRNRVENLSTATAAYSTMKAAGMNDADAIRISRLDPNHQAVADRNKQAKEEELKQAQEQMAQQNNNQENNKEVSQDDKRNEEPKV